MGKQTIRQRARRQALDVAARHRRERVLREKRLQGLAASAIAVVMERDQFVASADRRIGESLRQMTEVEGLTLREAIEWCGGGITRQEATRLRHLARRDSHGQADPDDAKVANPAAAAAAEDLDESGIEGVGPRRQAAPDPTGSARDKPGAHGQSGPHAAAARR